MIVCVTRILHSWHKKITCTVPHCVCLHAPALAYSTLIFNTCMWCSSATLVPVLLHCIATGVLICTYCAETVLGYWLQISTSLAYTPMYSYWCTFQWHGEIASTVPWSSCLKAPALAYSATASGRPCDVPALHWYLCSYTVHNCA
jgi:hypothetical protein